MKKIVVVSGGFDPLHSGHIAYFEAARKLGDMLIVGVNSDAWLTRKKGAPFMLCHERVTIVENIRVVDNVILFNDTIAANVAYGSSTEGIDRGRVIESLEAANLTGLLTELPNGIDTLVGDNGNRLSGGQRQRLAIARAIYKDAPILILDEATSALDSESERQVQEALDRLMAGRTTLVIAHRLSTIEHADRIAVLDHGEIVEYGSHQELMAKNGLYAGLHRLQFSEVNS